MIALIPVDKPSPVGFSDVYEEGDEWMKTVGCEGCSNTEKCCGKCRMLSNSGCGLHLRSWKNKPFGCLVRPYPNDNWSWCRQEFKCVEGEHKGKIRKVSKPAHVFG